MSDYTLVTIENYYEIITTYIKKNDILISEYDDMTECILRMIRGKYCFNMDKNLLRGFLEDLTYMFSPNDDKNKDRIDWCFYAMANNPTITYQIFLE